MKRTKPENTEATRAKREQKRAAIRDVALSGLFRICMSGLMLALRTKPDTPQWLSPVFLILAVVGLASVPLSLPPLLQRLREIDKGELDEARKY